MKRRLYRFFSSDFVFFFITTFIILALNLTPLIADIFHSPPGRTFTLVHNNAQDFFFYQSLMNQGAGGAYLTSDPYTTETHQSSIIFSYFLWLGKLSRVLALPYAVTYHLARIVLSIMFFFAAFYLIFQLNIPHPRLAFFFFLFSAPLLHPVNLNGKTEWIPYMNWWTGMDPIRRAAYLPHHMFGSLFLVLSLIFLLKYMENPKGKFLIFLVIFAALLAFVHTPSLMILLIVIPPALLLNKSAFVAFRKFIDSPFIYFSNQSKKGIKYLGLLIYWSSGVLFLLLMILQTNKGFPWSQYIAWERKLQFPLIPEISGALGFLLPFAVIGVAAALYSRRFSYILTAYWFLVPLFLIPLAPALNISNIRLIQGAPYLPLAILAVIGIEATVIIISKFKIQRSKSKFKIKNLIRSTLILVTGDLSQEDSFRAAKNTWSEHEMGLRSDRIPKLRKLINSTIFILFILFTLPLIYWSLKDQIREYWPIFGNIYFDNRLQKAFDFINSNFPKNSHTLGTFYTGNYLPAYTHTISFIGHSGYTYNIDEKQAIVRRFFENKLSDKEAKELITNNKIVLIFQGPEEKPIYQNYLYPNLLKPIYDTEEVTLYVPKN